MPPNAGARNILVVRPRNTLELRTAHEGQRVTWKGSSWVVAWVVEIGVQGDVTRLVALEPP